MRFKVFSIKLRPEVNPSSSLLFKFLKLSGVIRVIFVGSGLKFRPVFNLMVNFGFIIGCGSGKNGLITFGNPLTLSVLV